MLLFPAGNRPSCCCAARELEKCGVSLCDHVSPDVTHLLLDIPSPKDTGQLLSMLPPDITVIGGNLDHLDGYQCLDLLKDEIYLAQNAAITADCALKVAREKMDTTWADTRVLILGWGRIGKCLMQTLKDLGSEVTVWARKEKDRAMVQALGCQAASAFSGADVVFNTVPEMVWEDCPARVKVDLASRPGLKGEDVVWARGIPGIHAPRTTGRLIARRILQEVKK